MRGETGQDDLSLVRAAARGDKEAFDALVLRHQDRLFGVIHRLVGDTEKAMDLAQETFLRAWRGLGGFQGDASFFTWLYRIARNVVTSMARYDGVRPRLQSPMRATSDDDVIVSPEPASDAETPGEELLASERRALVLSAIAALPSDFREVVVLRDLDDRSYEDIAELLEIPVGTVRSRLHRARLDLKDRLKPMLDPRA